MLACTKQRPLQNSFAITVLNNPGLPSELLGATKYALPVDAEGNDLYEGELGREDFL
jgi:hypothetical protein